MPKVPKWMADAMESLFSGSYHAVTVTEVEQLDARLKRVRFEGDFARSKRRFAAGNVIEFRVNATEFRHYTPAYFDHDNGICDVLFYLHGMGPGSRWASALRRGDELKLLGPGGKLKLDDHASAHFIFGDETSLGLMECMTKAALARNQSIDCLAELDTEHLPWVELVDCPVDTVSKPLHANATIALKKVNAFLQKSQGANPSFYLTGNAKSIQAIKKHLLHVGVKTSRIQTDPYWAAGKAGL